MMNMERISDKFYVEVSIVAESGVLLAQITVFFAKFVSRALSSETSIS